MVIINLLPYDLHYNANDVENGRIYPGQQISLHEVGAFGLSFTDEKTPVNCKLILITVYSAKNFIFNCKLKFISRVGRNFYESIKKYICQLLTLMKQF